MKHGTVAFFCLALIGATGVRGDMPPSPMGARDERAAVQRALPYLARQTDAWIEKQHCTSCHQVPHALWAMNRARSAGFEVDDRLADWNRWSLDFVLGKSKKEPVSDELYQMLLAGADRDDRSADQAASTHQQLVAGLMTSLNKTGHWEAQGQLPYQKRPKKESDEATSLWILHVLRHETDNQDAAHFAQRGFDDIGAKPGVSTEHLLLRLLAAHEGKEPERAAGLTNELLDSQNDDGGWGWLRAAPSDAIATGQALYALAFLASDRCRSAAGRARDYLIRTQDADGSWKTPSTLAKHDATPTTVSNDWGTAWAVIGLTRGRDRSLAQRDGGER